ncbi:MAG: glycoside hydrolase family 32 protein [Tessaracoccus sp.]
MTSNDALLRDAQAAIERSRAHLDPDYPRFHLAPPVGRLNDPNGLIVVDGVYHAFYQFGPFFPDRKLIYWGHASSTDLTSWQTHPPAVAPGDWFDRSGVYSGGAVREGGTVWLHYTGNVKDADGHRESYQCAVTTTDMEHFVKHPANPLIPGPPPGYTPHVRDPQVIRDGDGYLMLLGAQRADESGCILVYRGANLESWELAGELTFPGLEGRLSGFGYMWECPNLLRVPDEKTGEIHDVLIFCPQGVGPLGDGFANIFPCGYLIGELVGTAFHAAGEFVELDRGFEFYAPQVFSGSADGLQAGPVLMGWLGNASEDDQPSLREHGWVHMMSVPRRLSLRDGVLIQRPDLDLGPVHGCESEGAMITEDPVVIDEVTGVESYWLTLDVARPAEGEWTMTLGGGNDSRVVITFGPEALTVDRGATRYPHGERRTLAVELPDRVRIDLVHDRSVTEMFIDDGRLAFSMRTYLSQGTRRLAITSEQGGEIVAARVRVAK